MAESKQKDGMEAYPCPKCGQETSLSQGECEHCGADLSALQTTISAANVHFNRALEFVKEDRLDEAILEVQAALELWDRNPKYHLLLGKMLAQKGMFSRAIIQWEKAIELDSSSVSAYRNIEQARKLERYSGQRELQKVPRWALIGMAVFSLLMLVLVIVFANKYEDTEDDLHNAKKMNSRLESSVVRYEAQQTALAKWFQTPTPAPAEKPDRAQPIPTHPKVAELEEKTSLLQTQLSQRESLLTQYRNQLHEAKNKTATAEYNSSLLVEKLNNLQANLTAEMNEAKSQAAEARASEKRAREYALQEAEQNDLLKEQIRILERQQEQLLLKNDAALASLERLQGRILNLMNTDAELETYFMDILDATTENLSQSPQVNAVTPEMDIKPASPVLDSGTETQDLTEFPTHGYQEVEEITREVPLPETPEETSADTDVESATAEAAPVPESAT